MHLRNRDQEITLEQTCNENGGRQKRALKFTLQNKRRERPVISWNERINQVTRYSVTEVDDWMNREN